MEQSTGVYRKARQATREEVVRALAEILSSRGLNYWQGSNIRREFAERGFTFSHERVRVVFTDDLPDILNRLGLKVGILTVGDRWNIVISRPDAAWIRATK